MKISSYSSPFNFGHRALKDLFSDKVSIVMNGIWWFDKSRVFTDVF